MLAEMPNSTAAIWSDYIRSRSIADRNRLIEAYLPLVRLVANSLRRRLPRCVERDDLVNAGVFGLTSAIGAFDPERGARFETYASRRVRGAMLDWLREIDWVPRLVRQRKQTPIGVKSIESNLWESDRGPATLAGILAARSGRADAALLQRDEMARLTAGMDRAQRAMVMLYWCEELTMREVGLAVGLSESRVSQVIKQLTPLLRQRLEGAMQR